MCSLCLRWKHSTACHSWPRTGVGNDPVQDFKVSLQAGNIIEENHYYSFGLKIAAISSKKLGHVNEGVLKNDYFYNDKEFFDDGDLNWYNYGFRNYDPQIGRFVQLDPLTDYYPMMTPYQYAGNDPIANVDLDGLEPLSSVNGAVSGVTGAARDFTYAYNTASLVLGPAMQAATATSTVFTSINLVTSITSLVATGANIVSDIINSKSVTQQVGNVWILYDGQKVTFYSGDYENTDNPVQSFKGTSGIYTTSDEAGKNILKDYRNSKYQFKQENVIEGGKEKRIFVGPLPEGDYSIDLSLDPNRQTEISSNGETIPGKGIQKITYIKGGKEYVRYPDWGSQRAKLDANSSTKLGGRDGNFYFHNSSKGYTHGCIETETGFFTLLKTLRKTQATIRVKIQYKSQNSSTNGNTKKSP